MCICNFDNATVRVVIMNHKSNSEYIHHAVGLKHNYVKEMFKLVLLGIGLKSFLFFTVCFKGLS